MYKQPSALKMEPPWARFPPNGARSRHRLINQCNLRLAFKVRSPKHSSVYVRPTSGILEPSQQPGMHKETDKLSIIFVNVAADTKHVKGVFDSKEEQSKHTLDFVGYLNINLSTKVKPK